jgi:argininosuccinate lyase
VGRAVVAADEPGGAAGRAVAAGALDPADIEAAAREIVGRPLELDPGIVALDPVEAIATRTVPGGAAPEPMDAMLAACRTEIADAREWIDAERAAIERAEQELVALARR